MCETSWHGKSCSFSIPFLKSNSPREIYILAYINLKWSYPMMASKVDKPVRIKKSEVLPNKFILHFSLISIIPDTVFILKG